MKIKSLLFVIACLALCLIPSVGMLFFPTTETTENRPMAAAPELITDDGTVNTEFFNDFEDYFDEHIALRNQLIYVDAKIQTSVFHESNVSGVIAGTDGWLYYSSTLDDYLGRSVMSQRELYNLAHNFSIIQEYLEDRNIPFVLTIPPNKNTLYGENMPYYASYIVNSDHSAKLLAPLLSQQGVNYLNLFEMFEAHDETLYLLRDSHWNMIGACMAYNGIMDAFGLQHEDYSSADPVPANDENGDLNKMLYSFYGKPEENYSYDIASDYAYANDADSVEAGWIITENPSGTGALLMFRDSFANTLIPFLSSEFERAYFSKGTPNALEYYLEEYSPDCVAIEIVERNIDNYLNDPPIITAIETEPPKNFTIASTDSTVEIESSDNDINYYKISGTIDADRLQDGSDILVAIDGSVYKAYQIGENGYSLYMKKSAFAQTSTSVQVYVVNEDNYARVLSEDIRLPQ